MAVGRRGGCDGVLELEEKKGKLSGLSPVWWVIDGCVERSCM